MGAFSSTVKDPHELSPLALDANAVAVMVDVGWNVTDAVVPICVSLFMMRNDDAALPAVWLIVNRTLSPEFTEATSEEILQTTLGSMGWPGEDTEIVTLPQEASPPSFAANPSTVICDVGMIWWFADVAITLDPETIR